MTNTEMYDMYDRMFEMPAWKDLVEDFKQRKEDLGPQLIANMNASEKDLYRAQGLSVVYSYIIGLEATMDAAKRSENNE